MYSFAYFKWTIGISFLECWYVYFYNDFTLTGYTINCTSVDHFVPKLEIILKYLNFHII